MKSLHTKKPILLPFILISLSIFLCFFPQLIVGNVSYITYILIFSYILLLIHLWLYKKNLTTILYCISFITQIIVIAFYVISNKIYLANTIDISFWELLSFNDFLLPISLVFIITDYFVHSKYYLVSIFSYSFLILLFIWDGIQLVSSWPFQLIWPNLISLASYIFLYFACILHLINAAKFRKYNSLSNISSSSDAEELLILLKKQYESGNLTDEEYLNQKNNLLDNL